MDAKELFNICDRLADEKPSAEGLRQMHEVLTLCCSKGTRTQGGRFGNLFSQVDFVCKQHGLSNSDRVEIQTLRRHTKGEGVSQDDWRYDLRALTLFVSTVFAEDVPGSLRQKLPSTGRCLPKSQGPLRPYVRCIVRSWDDQHITADSEDGEVLVDYGTTDHGRDLGYLRRLLREGMQLNLLESRVDGDVLVPRLIVVEPDFLIDISSVAACFTPYGHHPLLYTVNRLKERPNTQAVLLGNFAGAALDNIIACGSKEKEESDSVANSLKQTLRRSFREQAMRFCACPDFNAEQFKRDAQAQIRNIQEAVTELFDKERFYREKALLEPSFICEQLGLQGRVDLMTSDMKLLVEQKSGKNMKIERDSHDSHGLQKEDHYVQLLLYYGILQYNFGRTDKTVDIRLLYSRYPACQGLLSVNYYRQLFREAIRLRNQIVATELFIAREGFGRIIPQLAPSIIYKEVKADGYFTQYILPELQALSDLLQTLPPTERAYYERMMTFVYREQACQKLGTADTWLQHSSGAVCDLWQMPLSQKQDTGNIITVLSIEKQEKTDEQSGYDRITLNMPPTPVLNFRRGDMVYLYAYRDTPDVRQSILYKGTLEAISSDNIVVRLTNGQQSPDIFNSRGRQQWAVEHGGSDSMASGSIRSLQQFITAQPRRKALLLGQRTPEADTTQQLARSYSPAYNDILLRVRQSLDYFLLVGPPGTGKTSQALRFMVEEELSSPHSALLLTAYTNRAVDEICAMLDDSGNDYLRLGNEASCDERFKSHLLETRLAADVRLDDISRYISHTRIVVSTTSMLQARPYILQLKQFSLCIVDEASQILEPGIIGILANDNIDRFVLIGDYKQLPAVVQQDGHMTIVTEPMLNAIGITDCRQSLFERLFRWEQHCGRTQFTGILNRQGRMHPEVALFPNTHFYAAEQILPVPLPHQQEDTFDYAVPAQDALDELLKSKRVLFFNETDEAPFVAKLLHRIQRFYGQQFNPEKTVGVIVPYRNLIGRIRHELEVYHEPALFEVCIDTVERYQGSQRDVIIYAFGVEHAYQLDFLTANTFEEGNRLIDRKLNVAMTRARRQLIMTGRADLLRQSILFRQLIDKYETKR